MEFESLLYSVFEELRSQGVPLGISEYLVALKVIQEGGVNSLENKASLQRLCRLLWAKSREDQEHFDRIFEKNFSAELETSSLSDRDLMGAGLPLEFPFRPTRSGLPEEIEQEPERPTWHRRSETLPLVSNNEPPQGTPDVPHHSYQLIPHLPIDRRDMIGIWRHLRKLQREGPLEELNVQGTIDVICHDGIFVRPVLQPRRRNQARLVLLVDQSSSMEPFSWIIEAFIDCIERSGLNRQIKIFYFRNYPDPYLFETPGRTQARKQDEVFANECKGQSVLIISDAGAARGEYRTERVERTKECIMELQKNTYLYAWLNPLPAVRWRRTTAEDIHEFVPMYPLDRDGVNDAVDILRGQPFPREVRLHE